jgi:hypothetical protein
LWQDLRTALTALPSLKEIIKTITIEESRFGFEPEITAKIAKLASLRVYEVGVTDVCRGKKDRLEGWSVGPLVCHQVQRL